MLINKNEVTYVNVKAPVYILQLDYPSAYPIIGNEYNAIYGYKWAGLSEEGLPQVYNENGEKVTNQPTTLDAISYMGTTTPKYSGSFGTSISYKDFDFSMQFLFAGGHKMRNANPAFLTCSYSSVGYISNIAGASALLIVGRNQVMRLIPMCQRLFLPKVVCQHLLCIVLIFILISISLMPVIFV